jgi:hypothetical protein
MHIFILVLKILGSLTGLAIILPVLFVVFTIARKSLPFCFRSDIKQLTESWSRDSGIASRICGAPCDRIAGAKVLRMEAAQRASPPEAKITVLSSRLLFPVKGRISVRVEGIGVDKSDAPVSSQPCAAILTFNYFCGWASNGRSYVFERYVTGDIEVERIP